MRHSGKYLRLLGGILFLIFIAQTAIGQIVVLDGRELTSQDGTWYVREFDTDFLLDTMVVTVRWRRDSSRSAIDSFLRKNGMTESRQNVLGFADVQLKQTDQFLSQYDLLRESPLVESIEINARGYWGTGFPPPVSPDDDNFPDQWYLYQNGGIDINAKEGWGYSTGSPTTVVAVLDEGFDWLHEDLGDGQEGYGNVWTNPAENDWTDPEDPSTGNDTDDDQNGYVDDWKGWNFVDESNNSIGTASHGTFVAGIVGAKTNNEIGISGVSGGNHGAGVRMLSVVVGDSWGPDGSVVDDAILYAVAAGARVINMSFWITQSAAVDSAIVYANSVGCVLVACGGNQTGPYPCAAVWYPARHSLTIAVAGITKTGDAYPSCKGTAIDISAPAGTQDPHDPTNYGIFSTKKNDDYGYVPGGTSFAAPQVVGAAALLLAVDSSLTPAEIRCILESTATDMGPTGKDTIFGYGRVDLQHALQASSMLLTYPAHQATVPPNITLKWHEVFGASTYHLQVAANSNFTNPIVDETGISSKQYSVSLAGNTLYSWRVEAEDYLCNLSRWSDTRSFTTTSDSLEPESWTGDQIHKFKLYPAFPNPFNTSTRIAYSISQPGMVRLDVVDVFGRLITTLVHEVKSPGQYEITWDASNCASGVYFVHLRSDLLSSVGRILLSK